MNIAIAGSSGFIGKSLTQYLTQQGHTIERLTRDPSSGQLILDNLDSCQAVINLAGENIASGRWTKEKKRKIYESRVLTTKALTKAIIQLKNPPSTFINASAIGYYGNQVPGIVDENSPSGEGFLAHVCRDWEAATAPAEEKGIRVVHMRIGIVLDAKGGALAAMLVPFRLGVAGVMGSGNQYMSWIVREDLVRLFHHCLMHEEFRGAVNAVTPNSVTNREFTKTLGRILHRPTLFPMPSFLARWVLGEMADELLLSSVRAYPKKLVDSSFAFQYPELEGALRYLVG